MADVNIEIKAALVEAFKPFIHCAACSVNRAGAYAALKAAPDDEFLKLKFQEAVTQENAAVEACAKLFQELINADSQESPPASPDSKEKLSAIGSKQTPTS